jgi:hypothetical protein
MKSKFWLKTMVAAGAGLFALSAQAASDYPSGYTKCAKEGEICTMTGSRTVAFGKSGSFVYATQSGSFTCNASLFPSTTIKSPRYCSYGNTATATPTKVAATATPTKVATATPTKVAALPRLRPRWLLRLRPRWLLQHQPKLPLLRPRLRPRSPQRRRLLPPPAAPAASRPRPAMQPAHASSPPQAIPKSKPSWIRHFSMTQARKSPAVRTRSTSPTPATKTPDQSDRQGSHQGCFRQLPESALE